MGSNDALRTVLDLRIISIAVVIALIVGTGAGYMVGNSPVLNLMEERDQLEAEFDSLYLAVQSLAAELNSTQELLVEEQRDVALLEERYMEMLVIDKENQALKQQIIDLESEITSLQSEDNIKTNIDVNVTYYNQTTSVIATSTNTSASTSNQTINVTINPAITCNINATEIDEGQSVLIWGQTDPENRENITIQVKCDYGTLQREEVNRAKYEELVTLTSNEYGYYEYEWIDTLRWSLDQQISRSRYPRHIAMIKASFNHNNTTIESDLATTKINIFYDYHSKVLTPEDANFSFEFPLPVNISTINYKQTLLNYSIEFNHQPLRILSDRHNRRYRNISVAIWDKYPDEPITVKIEAYFVRNVLSENPVVSNASFPITHLIPPDIIPYVKEAAYQIEPYNQTIKELAYELSNNCETESEVVQSVLNWVDENMEYTSNLCEMKHPHASYLITTRLATCEGYANVIASLLRANGIPARHRYCFRELDRGNNFVYTGRVDLGIAHALVEVWYPDIGWVLYDSTFYPESAYKPFWFILANSASWTLHGEELCKIANPSSNRNRYVIGTGTMENNLMYFYYEAELFVEYEK